jgi:hypothetical protein
METEIRTAGEGPAIGHDFGATEESWRGTKEQLQAAGIGTGMDFPGEAGAPEHLACKCPLGFEVFVYRSGFDPPGVYRAFSPYLPAPAEDKDAVAYAPGVTRKRGPWSWEYRGTAEALASAGLAAIGQFPGQPGRPLHLVSYRVDEKGSLSAKRGGRRLRIKRISKDRFEVSIDFDEQQRTALEAAGAAHLKACEAARKEREDARAAAAQAAAQARSKSM